MSLGYFHRCSCRACRRDGCCITERVAVEIPGEEERIRRLVVRADRLLAEAKSALQWREGREVRVQNRAGVDSLGADSPRLTCLFFAAQSLEHGLEQLLAAYVASGAMTDEPPF